MTAFDVWFTPTGHRDYADLRADLQRAVDIAAEQLGRRGCAGADYRLAGDAADVGRLCVVNLQRDWRLVVGFPAPAEVAVLVVGRHLRGARSVYERLYRLLGVEAPADERRKPPCCDDDAQSPVATDLVDRIVRNAKQLRR